MLHSTTFNFKMCKLVSLSMSHQKTFFVWQLFFKKGKTFLPLFQVWKILVRTRSLLMEKERSMPAMDHRWFLNVKIPIRREASSK
jgi:hypothetical protein